jgi:hypothetical protein
MKTIAQMSIKELKDAGFNEELVNELARSYRQYEEVTSLLQGERNKNYKFQKEVEELQLFLLEDNETILEYKQELLKLREFVKRLAEWEDLDNMAKEVFSIRHKAKQLTKEEV